MVTPINIRNEIYRKLSNVQCSSVQCVNSLIPQCFFIYNTSIFHGIRTNLTFQDKKILLSDRVVFIQNVSYTHTLPHFQCVFVFICMSIWPFIWIGSQKKKKRDRVRGDDIDKRMRFIYTTHSAYNYIYEHSFAYTHTRIGALVSVSHRQRWETFFSEVC